MRSLLCATDYSKNSLPALKLGYALSKRMGIPLIVLHVFDINVALVTPLSMTFARIQKEAFEKHRQKLTQLCEKHLGVLPDDRLLKIQVKENTLTTEALIEAIKEFDAMMVLMGMKGTSAIKDSIMGSGTRSMIDKSPCPVMAIPPTIDSYEINTIAYASDFEESDIHAIAWILNTLAKPLELPITIVHISTEDEYAGKEQMEWFKEMLQQKISYDKLHYAFVEEGNVFKGLTSYLKRTKSDLVVMLERERGGLIKALTHIDRVKLMASKGRIPLLSINKKNAV